MNKYLIFIVALILLSACSPTDTNKTEGEVETTSMKANITPESDEKTDVKDKEAVKEDGEGIEKEMPTERTVEINAEYPWRAMFSGEETELIDQGEQLYIASDLPIYLDALPEIIYSHEKFEGEEKEEAIRRLKVHTVERMDNISRQLEPYDDNEEFWTKFHEIKDAIKNEEFELAEKLSKEAKELLN